MVTPLPSPAGEAYNQCCQHHNADDSPQARGSITLSELVLTQ